MVENPAGKKETVEEFLARGGKITVIPPGHSSLVPISESRSGRRQSKTTRPTENASPAEGNAALADEMNFEDDE